MTGSETRHHNRGRAWLARRWSVACVALLVLTSSATSALAQNYTFDARRVALGGTGGVPNVAAKIVERQRRYKSIMIPVGLFRVLSNLHAFNPLHEDFDFSRAVEYGYSPLHHVYGRSEDLQPSSRAGNEASPPRSTRTTWPHHTSRALYYHVVSHQDHRTCTQRRLHAAGPLSTACAPHRRPDW